MNKWDSPGEPTHVTASQLKVKAFPFPSAVIAPCLHFSQPADHHPDFRCCKQVLLWFAGLYKSSNPICVLLNLGFSASHFHPCRCTEQHAIPSQWCIKFQHANNTWCSNLSQWTPSYFQFGIVKNNVTSVLVLYSRIPFFRSISGMPGLGQRALQFHFSRFWQNCSPKKLHQFIIPKTEWFYVPMGGGLAWPDGFCPPGPKTGRVSGSSFPRLRGQSHTEWLYKPCCSYGKEIQNRIKWSCMKMIQFLYLWRCWLHTCHTHQEGIHSHKTVKCTNENLPSPYRLR